MEVLFSSIALELRQQEGGVAIDVVEPDGTPWHENPELLGALASPGDLSESDLESVWRLARFAIAHDPRVAAHLQQDDR